MSVMEIALTVALAAVAFLALVLGINLQRLREGMVERERHWLEEADDETRKFRDLHTVVMAALPSHTRYEIVLADWGPDFTGMDGVLPRWRWSVVDADRHLRDGLGLMGTTEIGTDDVPFMLGNAISPESAVLAAVQWIEREQHPPQILVIDGEVFR